MSTPNASQQGAGGSQDAKKKRNRRKPNKKITANSTDSNNTQGGSVENKSSDKKRQTNRRKNKEKKSKNDPKNEEPTPEELAEQKRLKEEKEKQAAILAAQKAEAARLQKIKEEQNNLNEQFKKSLVNVRAYIQQSQQNHRLREQLLNPQILLEKRSAFANSKKKLKTDLKKCNAFSKKIKTAQSFDTINVTSMLKDVDTLNLTRYLDEIATAFLDTVGKLKLSDAAGIVKVLVAFHERYKEFVEDIFMEDLLSRLKKKDTLDGKQKRIITRILIELILSGVLSEPKPLMKTIVEASGAPKGNSTNEEVKKNEKYLVSDANLLVSFAKAAGHELTGIIPASVENDLNFVIKERMRYEEQIASTTINEQNDNVISDQEKEVTEVADDEHLLKGSSESDVKPITIPDELMDESSNIVQELHDIREYRAVSEEVCNRFKKHLKGAYESLSTTLVATHKKLSKMEKRCEEDRLLAGTLTEQRETALNDARKLLESLKKSVEVLSDTLCESIPELEEEKEEEKEETAIGLEVYKEDGQEVILGAFDDEETRVFYCDIPDLLTTIPPTLLGYSEQDIAKVQELVISKYGVGDSDVDITDDFVPSEETRSSENDFDEEDLDVNNEVIVQNDDEGEFCAFFCRFYFITFHSSFFSDNEDSENKDTPHYKLMVLLEQELPECNRRERIDFLAEKFCTNHGTNKNARKRIKKALFLVPRSRLDLIPYYSRLAAIFDRVFPEIASTLVTELEQQFHGLARWKKQQNIESRIRNAKFIGELTKFKVAPPIVALRCLRRCVQDFSGNNIDIACCLLESCGRFLHKTNHTTSKLTQIMDTIMRIRKARHFDERSIEMIKSAFYMVKPPQKKIEKKIKILSPMEEYIKELLLVRLDKSNVSFISKQLMRLPWSDESIDCGEIVVKYMLKVCRRGRYNSISSVASLVSSCKKGKPEVCVRIIDFLLEELRFIMEKPSMRDQQRAIVYAKLFGELHNFSLVPSQIIFGQLYDFVNFGHAIPDSIRNASVENQHEESISMPSKLKSSLGVIEAIQEDEELEEEDNGGENSDEDNDDKQIENQEVAPIPVSPFAEFDPRVPSVIDPPSAVFRIKLICTLLDSCVSSLVTATNLPKLDVFLAAFQRYIFIKDFLPTDIEFSLLDTFDLIESCSKIAKKDNKKGAISRYKNWVDAHNSVIKHEELEKSHESKMNRRLLHQAGLLTTLDQQDLQGVDSDDEMSTNSVEDEDNSDSGEEMSEDEIESEDDDSEDEEGSDEDDENENDDDDEVLLQMQQQEEEERKNREDELFEQELRKLTMEALEKGKNAARTMASTKVSGTMPSASQFIRGKKSSQDLIDPSSNQSSVFALSGASGMNFQLIKRGRKGKAEAKRFVVPTDTNLAKIASMHDDEAARERDMLKARVLRYEAESAENYTGDVYMDQGNLPEVRNRTLRNIDIDKHFGKSTTRTTPYSGRGHYRGRGTPRGGRGLKRF
jgi:regulator of nonsense transcripts 2